MKDDTLGRRGFVGAVGAGAVLVSTGVAGSAGRARAHVPPTETTPPSPAPGSHPENPAAPSAPVAAMLAAVPVGTQLGALRVVATFDVFKGAVPVLLEDAAGRRVQLDVLAASLEGPAPLAQAGAFAVFVTDGADGDAPAHPAVAAAARALAPALGPRPRGLLDHATRMRRHGRDVLSVLDNPLR